ncbi:MAG: acyl-CoA thioesterase [Planctomycetota bacterium]|jgi:acyl-CoA thioester hydrolase
MSDSETEDLVVRHRVRVRYGETDQMGVAHHGSYVAWIEEARTEWLRVRGMRYKELEEGGLRMPVVSLQFNYKSSVGYDEVVEVETRVNRRTRASVSFSYRIRTEEGGRLVADAETVLACVDSAGKVRRLPEGV